MDFNKLSIDLNVWSRKLFEISAMEFELFFFFPKKRNRVKCCGAVGYCSS